MFTLSESSFLPVGNPLPQYGSNKFLSNILLHPIIAPYNSPPAVFYPAKRPPSGLKCHKWINLYVGMKNVSPLLYTGYMLSD